MEFKCKKCKETKVLSKTITVYKDGQWVVKDTECPKCGKYMEEVLDDTYGMPTIIRNEGNQKKF